MKQTIFDLKLYREGMRQTRSLGILFTVVMSLLCLYNAIWQGFQGINNVPYFIDQDAAHLMAILFLAFTLAAPFLSLKLFGFVNFRQTSDFYHALPQQRLTLYFSFLAVIVSWLFLIVFTTTLLTGLSTLLFPSVYQINWGEFLIFAAAMWVTSLYVAAATVCAMSLSGNYFSNTMIALLLIFGPRLVLFLLGNIATLDISVISMSFIRFPLAPQANLATMPLWRVLGGAEHVWIAYFQAENILFTLGLAIFFTALGAFCFKIRKSETAGRAALFPRLGTAVRLALSFFPCIYGISQLFKQLSGQNVYFNLPGTVISFLLGIVVYFGYEFLASRKVSALKKALPGLALLPVICGLALGGMLLTRSSIVNFRPAADEIRYVRILEENAYRDDLSSRYLSQNSYFNNRVAQIKLDDPFVRELMARSLADTLDGKWDYHFRERSAMVVAFDAGGGERTRQIIMTTQDAEKLREKISENETYRNIWQDLPDENSGGFSIYASSMTSGLRQTKEIQPALKRIYACLRQEAAAMDFENWMKALENPWGIVDSLSVTIARGGSSEFLSLAISESTPRTMDLYFKELAALKDPARVLAQARKVLQGGDQYSLQLELYVVELEGDTWDDYRVVLSGQPAAEYYDWYGNEKKITPEEAAALLDQLELLQEPAAGRILIRVKINTELFTKGTYSNDVIWFSADTLPDFLQEWKKQWENQMEYYKPGASY